MSTEVDERALRETTDAAVWAKAFLEVIDQPDVQIDFGLMVGWFANAIETARMLDRPPANYDAALHCSDCGHFLLPHDVAGHDKWHDEPRR